MQHLGFLDRRASRINRCKSQEPGKYYSQTIRDSSNRTAIILQEVGHPHFSKENNIKAGCQVVHMLPLASSAFWNSRTSIKPRLASFQLNSWGKKILKFLFASWCLPQWNYQHLMAESQLFFPYARLIKKYLPPKNRPQSMWNGNWKYPVPLQEHCAFCPLSRLKRKFPPEVGS